MKRAVFLFILFIVSINITGCVSASNKKPTSESAFMSGFEIGSIIEASQDYLVSGSSRPVWSDAVAAPPSSFFQKHQEAVIDVDPSEVSAFMQAIKFDIHQALTDSGAEVLGSGAGGIGTSYFSFHYSLDESNGVINVWGMQGEGMSFTLIVLITESFGS